MKIQSLEVVAYRSIKQLNLMFKPGINVIAGVNGAGKSTLLTAIEVMLSRVKAKIRLRASKGLYPNFSDISHGTHFTSIGIRTSEPTGLFWEMSGLINFAFDNL
ncbi:MAG: AAA family ATPase [Muribaculaceae bacterium]|nr:AAA family ATPase [Muribaculaceae bacterium]